MAPRKTSSTPEPAPAEPVALAEPVSPDEKDAIGSAILEALAVDAPSIGLAAKLAGVYADVRRIPKRGWNEGQKYAFANEGDISDMIRWSLHRHRVVFACKIVQVTRNAIRSSKGTEGTEVIVDVEFVMTCADTGEAWTFPWQGEATDYQDKALPKALTGAKKSFLVMQFLVSTGEPEPDAGPGAEGYSRAGAPPAGRSSGAPAKDGYNRDGTPDTREATSGQRGRIYGLAKESPFLATVTDGKVKVSEVAVHNLVAWVTRDDPNGPVTSLSDLNRWQIARVFNVIEKTNASAELAGKVAASVAEWIEGQDAPAPEAGADPPFAETDAEAAAEVDPEGAPDEPADDDEPAPEDDTAGFERAPGLSEHDEQIPFGSEEDDPDD